MRLSERLREDMYACGTQGPPERIVCHGQGSTKKKLFKHDFLAATALYETDTPKPGAPSTIVCKFNRRRPFFFLPLGWLGRLITHNECSNLRRCVDIVGVPEVMDRLDSHSYAYRYIEGVSLASGLELPTGFFDGLLTTLQQIHEKNVIHFDLHKPGNILLGVDGRGHLIDFQVSIHISARILLSRRLTSRFRRWLQSYDIYHLCKHKRRLQPHELTEAERALSYNHNLALRLHRMIAVPYKKVRRVCLRHLYGRGILVRSEETRSSAETDPERWLRK